MPTVQAAIYIEYSLNSGGFGSGIFTGSTLVNCINQCRSVPDFKHIDNYQILTYRGQAVQFSQPTINQTKL